MGPVGAPGGQFLDLVRDLLIEAYNALPGLLIADRKEQNDDQQPIEKEQQEHKPALVGHTQFIFELGEPAAGGPAFLSQAWEPGHSLLVSRRAAHGRSVEPLECREFLELGLCLQLHKDLFCLCEMLQRKGAILWFPVAG